MKSRKIKCFFSFLAVLAFLGFIGYIFDSSKPSEASEPATTTTNSSTSTTSMTSTTGLPVVTYSNEEDFLNAIMEDVKKTSTKSSFRLVAHAEDSPNIYKDTRYPATTDTQDLSWVADVLEVILPYVKEAAEGIGTGLAERDAQKINTPKSKYGFPAMPTWNAIKYIVENANNGNQRSLANQYSFIAKRAFDYPFLNLSEVDYLIVYVDQNADPFNNQNIFYQDTGVPANSFCLVRQVNTSVAVRQQVLVFPSMYFSLSRLAYGEMSFTINPSGAYSEIIAYTVDGSQTYKMYAEPYYVNRYIDVPVVNNSYNTIHDTTLIDFYNDNGKNAVLTYSGTERPFTGLECIAGLYFNPEYGASFMGFSEAPDWFLSCGFLNGDYSNLASNSFSITDNINVRKAPAYIVNDNSVVYEGAQLTTNNVDQYFDYGVTYNNESQKFEIDYDQLTAKINADIIPEFQNTFDLVYKNQPEIGLDFNTPLTLDMPDISNQLINDLVIGGGGGGWQEPFYPEINTEPYITATIPNYSNLVSQTVDQNVIDSSGRVVSMGWGFLDTLGLTAFLIPLVFLGLLWRSSGGD